MQKDLQQLYDEFIRELRVIARFSEKTLEGLECRFKIFKELMPDIQISMINDLMMVDFFEKLQNRKRVVGKGTIKTGVKKGTIATYRNGFNKFFDWLIKKGYLDENPFDKMPYPRVDERVPRYLKKEEVEQIITAIQLNIKWLNLFVQKRNMAIIAIMLFCGLRKGEVINLKIYDIDMSRRLLTVIGNTSKSQRDRTIKINNSAYKYLLDYLHERERKKYLTPYFFVSNNLDGKLTEHGFKHLIEDLNKKSGVKFTAHQFRHTFAVNLVMNNISIVKISEWMGHADIKTTAKYLRSLPINSEHCDLEKLTISSLY